MSLAVVTGGGSGIGAEVARVLAVDHEVLLVGRRAEPLALTAKAINVDRDVAGIIEADLSTTDGAEAVSWLVADQAVDVLVHCAGLMAEPGPTLADVEAHWLHMVRANVLPAVLLTEALRDRLTGCVVAVGSIAAQRGGHGAYSAAKAALHAWAFDQARVLAPVRVNVISPGYVEGTGLFPGGRHPDHDGRVAQTLTGRAGTTQDVADAVLWLVRATHVTGQIISVNGGALIGR